MSLLSNLGNIEESFDKYKGSKFVSIKYQFLSIKAAEAKCPKDAGYLGMLNSTD